MSCRVGSEALGDLVDLRPLMSITSSPMQFIYNTQ